ncbi:MAG: hypothetical protein DRP85_01030 [Candidatus Makaraimicrobium thalassicum]|nr:MAG: hypothetical protein DRP85_01030 [Candidatus Omnitrophota bacterium]
MARRRTSRKRKRVAAFLSGKAFSVKLALIFLVCAVVSAALVFSFRCFFLNSPLFTIKGLVINRDRGYAFREGEKKLKKIYVGRNIFTVDLRQAQRFIKNEFPEIEKAEVRRNLPDRMEIDIIRRKPVAVIDAGGGIAIDREGVVLSIGKSTGSLVKIKGISFFLNMPSKGGRIRDRSVARALALVAGISKRMHENKKDIEYIDISDRNNILLGICGVTVKMGGGDFPGKINILKEILEDPDIKTEDINYIDLRFEDAVISLK